MKKIISDFPVGIGKICFMSALVDILHYYDVDLNEGDLFGLCEGNLFYYGGIEHLSTAEINHTNLIREFRMGGMKYDVMQILDVLKKSIGLNIDAFRESDNINNIINEYISKDIPILSLVLRYYLEYCPGYKVDNFSHTITIYGIDDDNDRLYVTDTYLATKPISNYKGKMLMDNFIKSLNLSNAVFNMTTPYRLFAIYPNSRVTFKSIPIKTLNRSLINMANKNLDDNIIDGNIYTGIKALNKFSVDFEKWLEIYEDSILKTILEAVHLLITNYGGPYVTCGLLGEYLNRIFLREDTIVYRNLADEFIELQRLWLIIGNMCYRSSMDIKKDYIIKIIDKINNLILKQKRLYESIVMLED
ncbi:MAG: BtrH N-terminal domain-containing protein [Clostridiales bacterium]|nr:BtrH N-terminal domain-containing protein [Clostridiales bacterium]